MLLLIRKKMQISVIIPLYNKKETILRALQSVLNQKLLPSEILVVNDGSTDGSEILVKQINHPLIRLIHQDNAGVSAARNKGIVESKGDWIAFLDADDYWDIDYLETIYLLHCKYVEANILITKYKYFFDKEVQFPKIEFDNYDGILTNYFNIAVKGSPPIWTGAVCVSKHALLKVGLFPTEVKIGEDLLTWARLATRFDIAYSSSYKSNYCFPITIDLNYSFRLPDSNDFVGLELKMMLVKTSKQKTIGLKKYISHWHKMRLHLYAHHFLKKESIYEFVKCIKYNPYNFKAYLILLFAFLPIGAKNIVISRVKIFK